MKTDSVAKHAGPDKYIEVQQYVMELSFQLFDMANVATWLQVQVVLREGVLLKKSNLSRLTRWQKRYFSLVQVCSTALNHYSFNQGKLNFLNRVSTSKKIMCRKQTDTLHRFYRSKTCTVCSITGSRKTHHHFLYF
jgi:hypothetical protein